MLKSDEERGLVVGQVQPGDPVEAIARKNRKFEEAKAKRERTAVAEEIISIERQNKVRAAKDQLLNLLIEGDHADTVKDFVDDLEPGERQELIDSLKNANDPGDEDEEKPLTGVAKDLVDSVMKK